MMIFVNHHQEGVQPLSTRSPSTDPSRNLDIPTITGIIAEQTDAGTSTPWRLSGRLVLKASASGVRRLPVLTTPLNFGLPPEMPHTRRGITPERSVPEAVFHLTANDYPRVASILITAEAETWFATPATLQSVRRSVARVGSGETL
jgi:hypothetical protein